MIDKATARVSSGVIRFSIEMQKKAGKARLSVADAIVVRRSLTCVPVEMRK
jgi:hypothetical protein